MRVESRIFEILTIFFFSIGTIYLLWSREPAGSAALFLTGGLSLIVGTYFRFVARRLEAQARFGRLFAGELFRVYGGIARRTAGGRDRALDPDTAPRKRRPLRGPAPTASVKNETPMPINSPRARLSSCSRRSSS